MTSFTKLTLITGVRQWFDEIVCMYLRSGDIFSKVTLRRWHLKCKKTINNSGMVGKTTRGLLLFSRRNIKNDFKGKDDAESSPSNWFLLNTFTLLFFPHSVIAYDFVIFSFLIHLSPFWRFLCHILSRIAVLFETEIIIRISCTNTNRFETIKN